MRDYWIWMAGAPSPCLPADATAQGVSPCRYKLLSQWDHLITPFLVPLLK